MRKHLCLLIHCLQRYYSEDILAHKELFVQLKDVEKMIRTLRQEGYTFVLPMEIKDSDGPTCSLTFDDGYFNNSYFLELAEKYGIPFILFLTSYNVIHQVPFIWDIWDATRTDNWPISSVNYLKLYENLSYDERNLLENDSHRPFTPEELEAFAAHPMARVAPHGHTHQPMVGKYLEGMDTEVDRNIEFIARYEETLNEDFAFPCGLYTRKVIKWLLKRFKRVYTIDGGDFSPSDHVIHRISLLNPDFGGPLNEQINRSFSNKSKLFRKALNIRYSNRLFYRI